jgi:putative ABC transport system permease protein
MEHDGTTKGAFIQASAEMARTKVFEVRDGKLDFTGAVLSSKLADELEVQPGDDIEIVLGAQRATLTVTGVTQESLAMIVYTEPAAIASLFPATSATGVYIKMVDDSAADDAAFEMRAIPQVANVVVQKEVKESFEELLTMAEGFFYTFFLISALITIAVAGSAVIISAMERDVEFATLDTLGFSKWQVGKVVFVEMTVLGLLSALIGIPMAYLMAWLLAGVFEEILFFFPVVLVIGATITTFVFGVVLVLMSSVMPIRYSWKLDTDKTIRERTAG